MLSCRVAYKHTNRKCIYPRFLSLGNIFFELRDPRLNGCGQEGVLFLYPLPFTDDPVVDGERKCQRWCLISREEFLGEMRNLDDFVDVLRNTQLGFGKHE